MKTPLFSPWLLLIPIYLAACESKVTVKVIEDQAAEVSWAGTVSAEVNPKHKDFVVSESSPNKDFVELLLKNIENGEIEALGPWGDVIAREDFVRDWLSVTHDTVLIIDPITFAEDTQLVERNPLAGTWTFKLRQELSYDQNLNKLTAKVTRIDLLVDGFDPYLSVILAQ